MSVYFRFHWACLGYQIVAYLISNRCKRYGDYVVDFQQKPQPLETAIALPIHIDGA